MIEKLLRKIATSLDKNRIPYIIIGGQALLLYGRPRFTQDIDITLGIDTDHYGKIERICKKLKLKILAKHPEEFAENTKVLPAEDEKSKLRIDFIFSNTPYEQKALNRAKKIKIKNYPIKFASVEDLIIHKLFAARAIDLEDIRSIIVKNKNKINFKYIKKWLKKFSVLPESQDIETVFEKIRRGV